MSERNRLTFTAHQPLEPNAFDDRLRDEGQRTLSIHLAELERLIKVLR